jgi:poly-gamma-glutamate synthesis protein (capsule biosynthesis protein)
MLVYNGFWYLILTLLLSLQGGQMQPACSPGGDTLTIAFTGDILLDRGVRQQIERDGIESIFDARADSVFRCSDMVVGNLECPATTLNTPMMKKFVFRAEPEWLEALRAHGFTHLNLANNHTVDQGRRGLVDTWRNVERYGMAAVGVGNTMAEAAQPVLLAEHPRRVWLIASLQMPLEHFPYLPEAPSVNQESIDSMVVRIRALRAEDSTAVILVSLHWGQEHTLEPTPMQRSAAHRLIDAGADVLICHHTHTLQTIEQYHGKPIYYSLGNFIFDQDQDINRRTCVPQVKVTRDSVVVTDNFLLCKFH